MADPNVEQIQNDPNPNPNAAPSSGVKPDAAAGGGNTPPTSTEKTYSFKEDRSDWIPRTRLNEVSSKLTKLEQENLTYKEQLALAEKRTRALAGVEPKNEEAEQAEEIKSAILKLFPGLKNIENLTEEQIQDMFDAAQTAKSTTQAQWERHAESMFSAVEDAVADELGTEKLTDSQIKRIRREYREAAAEALAARPRDQQGRPVDPTRKDFLSRHEQGDKTLVTEFVKQFLADWYEPARRSVTRGVTSRQNRPVPRGERTRNTPVQGPPQIDYNNEDDFKKALLEARGSGA